MVTIGGTCSGCKHLGHGMCKRIKFHWGDPTTDTTVLTDPGAFQPAPDFGCVLWEGKSE
jgi:hypothetical protein